MIITKLKNLKNRKKKQLDVTFELKSAPSKYLTKNEEEVENAVIITASEITLHEEDLYTIFLNLQFRKIHPFDGYFIVEFSTVESQKLALLKNFVVYKKGYVLVDEYTLELEDEAVFKGRDYQIRDNDRREGYNDYHDRDGGRKEPVVFTFGSNAQPTRDPNSTFTNNRPQQNYSGNRPPQSENLFAFGTKVPQPRAAYIPPTFEKDDRDKVGVYVPPNLRPKT